MQRGQNLPLLWEKMLFTVMTIKVAYAEGARDFSIQRKGGGLYLLCNLRRITNYALCHWAAREMRPKNLLRRALSLPFASRRSLWRYASQTPPTGSGEPLAKLLSAPGGKVSRSPTAITKSNTRGLSLYNRMSGN